MKAQKADNRSSANIIHCDINKFFKKEKYNMSKRFLSILMALVICFSMLPTAALAETSDAAVEKTQNGKDAADVYNVVEDTVAQSGESGNNILYNGALHEHPICGDESCTNDGHKLPDGTKWVGVSELTDGMAEGYYYLTDDIVLGSI